MKPVQKIIKYLAIAFAIFLIINIISSILFGIYIFSDALNLNKSKIINEEILTTNFENSDVATLNIKLNYSNLTIKNGDTLKAATNDNEITCKQDNNQLIVEEKNPNWFPEDTSRDITIYIPENIAFDKVYIEHGAGKLEIDTISAKELLLHMGAGKVEIKNLNILNNAKIEGGVGKVSILNGEINNLDLDIGVGKFEINTKLVGKNKINAGIGKLDVILIDELSNYTISVDKGIGSINIDGKNVSDNTSLGNGINLIEVEGGIGSINIKSNK